MQKSLEIFIKFEQLNIDYYFPKRLFNFFLDHNHSHHQENQLERKKEIKIILQQKLSFSFIYSIIIVPPIPKDACGEHT